MIRIIKVVSCFSMLSLLAITSCKKDDVTADEKSNIISKNLPVCIEKILTDSIGLATLRTVKAIAVDDEMHL